MSLHRVSHPDERAVPPDRATPVGATERRGLRERVGEFLGRTCAPAVAAVSGLRQARTFHPRGLVFTGKAEAIVGGRFAALGALLEGTVLARCSAALWKHSTGDELSYKRFDVLGMALRFRGGREPITGVEAEAGDQDLLFATIRSPFTMLISPFTTDTSDYTRNRYWAVSPFAIEPRGARGMRSRERVELRLRPAHPMRVRGPRDGRLLEAVRAGRAAWWLEARETLTRRWHTIVRVTLEEPAELDQEALRFDPFRSGAGVVPVGTVHAIRRAAYSASQRARPDHDRDAR